MKIRRHAQKLTQKIALLGLTISLFLMIVMKRWFWLHWVFRRAQAIRMQNRKFALTSWNKQLGLLNHKYDHKLSVKGWIWQAKTFFIKYRKPIWKHKDISNRVKVKLYLIGICLALLYPLNDQWQKETVGSCWFKIHLKNFTC